MNQARISVWTKILLESILIVFSVLIALFLNEWKSQEKEAVRTELMLQHIESEIRSNQEIIQKVITYHKAVLASAKGVCRQDSLETIFFDEEGFHIYELAPNGIFQDWLNDTAWSVAKQDKITN
ncbi:MAG: hypothetical protein AAF738_08945, partial [Bacteroidota bacterium]